MANARGPSVFVRDVGPGSFETYPIMSIKYDSASPCRHLCTKAHVLRRILWCTGSQWLSSRMAAEIWSYFRILSIRRAADRVKDGLQWSEMNRTGTIQNTVAVVNSTQNGCVHQRLCRILRQQIIEVVISPPLRWWYHHIKSGDS